MEFDHNDGAMRISLLALFVLAAALPVRGDALVDRVRGSALNADERDVVELRSLTIPRSAIA
jgi:hypothetical protein